ncbi:Cwf15/Cwc15 cell cycle control protein [Wilcoxina mikolae CBS 423.85]|nr:Cwf15/Cwc15 cell cycle control protein [Wilcoxina mikolae CBS 423.85]
MTTAHRPTFDPARGKELPRGPSYHQRLLPAHTKLKIRQPGQGGDADRQIRDLRAELVTAEAAARAIEESSNHWPPLQSESMTIQFQSSKREMENSVDCSVLEQSKRRKIFEETRDIDADSDGTEGGCNIDPGDASDDDDEDETHLLLRELAKIKKERAQQAEKDARDKRKVEIEGGINITQGNSLLISNSTVDFCVKRRWDDDVIFKNQARGKDDRNLKKAFVNDLLRSKFHKKFMNKYVR